jgi:GrpB-like predicted nucleotidyltransferase (UPF0157 family)
MANIRIVAYDPLWPRIFGYLQARIWHQVAPHITAIVHVGSTAVPGMAAKPIIDMDIVVADQSYLAPVIALLAPLGYHHLGDLGIAGREAFSRPAGFANHNLYLCPQGSLGLRNHLALRNYLRATPAAVAAYSALKQRLAAAVEHDIDAYVAGKSDFISAILANQGLNTNDIATIHQSNQAPR